MKSLHSMTLKLLIFTTFFSLRVLSQTWLEQFSKQRGEKWQAERVHAESLARALNMPIRLDRSDGTTIELQRFENGRPLYYKTDNLNAAKTISTNKVWPAGGFGFSLTGNGIALGEWDAGKVRTTHQEFGGRVTSTQGTNNFHSTHVAGTMVASGVVASAQGMSYQAFLNAFDWNNDAAEMASQANLGLRVSNHSYGFISGWDFDSRGDNRWAWWGEPIISPIEDYTFGFYDASAKAWDLVAQNAPYYLIVNSAGNDRNEGPNGTVEHWVWNGSQWVLQTVARNKDCAPLGYDCLSDVSLSKNVLTVGAVNDIPNGYTTPGGVVMSSFSSWGPTDDGRIKPDIVANGVSLNSTLESADNDYGTLSGTSMASPNVAGSIGLLLEHQNNLHGTSPLLSSTLKAIILHTADEAGPNPGPDYTNGWGLMNTLKAVQLMSLDSIDGPNSHIRELILNQGDSILISVSSTGLEPLRATICWTDPPGQPVAPALDPPTIMLKNDVDLRIIREKDQTYYFPWILDPTSPSSPATTADNIRDNVEQVYIQNPERGVHLVKITHKSTLTDAPQHVSLIMSGNVPRIGPYVIAQPTNFSYELLPGGSRQDSVKIRNNGDTTLIYEISATPPSGWLTVSEDTGSIQPLDSTFINFTVDAALLSQWTTYNGTVSILSNDSGQTPYDVAVTLQTLGPTIEVTPLTIVADMDSGDTKEDSLKIKNSGFMPLIFSIRSSDPVFPQWLTLSDTTGTLSPGDSLFVRMTFDATSLSDSDYTASLQVVNNDSARGTIIANVTLYTGRRRIQYIQVNRLWNIVSLPVAPIDSLKTNIFPTAISDAYTFEENYNAQDSLREGLGYWLKFDSIHTIGIDGYRLSTDTVDVLEGWNIVGSLSRAVPVGIVSSIPSNIITSEFFSYYRGYQMSDSIYPGKGYWVQVDRPGKLVFSATYYAQTKITKSITPSTFNSLTIADDDGFSQTLYFGKESFDQQYKNRSSLPPKAPRGGFDVRFSSGKWIEIIPDNNGQHREYPIEIQSSSLKITLTWNIRSEDNSKYQIQIKEGEEFLLSNEGKLTLTLEDSESRIFKLIIRGSGTPKRFELHQNYPNPFNPVTIINYDLPVASYVTIKVYNVLGNDVVTLVNGVQDAGYKSVQWNAQHIPSGVYLLKIEASSLENANNKYNNIKKMVVMR